MNNKILIALFFGAVVGCVANEAVRAGTVTAQAQFAAPAHQYRECVGYVLNWHNDAEDLPGEAKPIPAGWTPVGGSGNGPVVILCR